MQNEIEELRGRVWALEQRLDHANQALAFLTPEVLAEMQELFKQEPAKKKGK